jgi:preprotein translocase subunit SecF
MKDGILLIERIIIESLAKKEKNIFELEIDTNLSQGILLNILPCLIMRNYIRYGRGQYSIDKESSLTWPATINSKNSIKEEVKEMFTTMVNGHFEEAKFNDSKSFEIKVQKLSLTNDEQKILNAHLVNLESFFNSVKKNRTLNPIKEKTCEQKVVIWGLSQYSDLINGALSAV